MFNEASFGGIRVLPSEALCLPHYGGTEGGLVGRKGSRRGASLMWLLLILSFPVMAQTIKVEAPSKVSQDDYFHLRFIVSSEKASNFRPPSLANFNILAGPSVSRSSSYQMINGKTSSSTTTTYTYVLSPRKAGTLQIGSATVSVGDRQLQSQAHTLQVVQGSASQKPSVGGTDRASAGQEDEIQTAGSRITSRDLFITATPSRTQVYEQEGILLTYKVHARLGVGLSNVMLAAKPDFTGLIAHEIPIKAIDTVPEKISGATYRTGTILQEVLFPSQSGEVRIPPVSFTCTVAQRQGHFSDPLDMFFNSGGTVGVEVQRTAPSLTISVKPLPQPRPAAFTGAVGKFSAAVSLPSAVCHAQEPVRIQLKVSGTGNMQMLTPPSLPLPDSFHPSTPTQEEDLRITPAGQTGTVTYTYTVTPPTAGRHTIPPLRYTYFNPATGRYEEAATQSITLDAAPPRTSRESSAAAAPDDAQGFSVPWTHLAIALSVLFIILVGALFLRRGKPRLGRPVPAFLLRMRRKAELRRALAALSPDAPAADIAALEPLLRSWLSERLALPRNQLSRDAIARRLAQTDLPHDDALVLLDALDTLAAMRYAPQDAPRPDDARIETAAMLRRLREIVGKKIKVGF